jgi:orotidine-5'-phosphate decarboxylase
MEWKIEKPQERLIVAADYEPTIDGGIKEVREKVLALAKQLKDMGIYIKINSILRACGYDLIVQLHDLGLQVMADLKLVDIPATMKIDGQLLSEVGPELVTVMANASIEGMSSLRYVLPHTELLAVTILTSLDEDECQQVFGCSTKAGVVRFARMAQMAGFQGLVLSPKEVEVIRKRKEIGLSVNTPGIRPLWSLVEGDDQKRTGTPEEVILAGGDRVIIGRPITKAKDPREAVQKTLDEIQATLEKKKQLEEKNKK